MHPDPVWWHWLVLVGVCAVTWWIPAWWMIRYKPHWFDVPPRDVKPYDPRER